jgi:hypothetical protein
MSKEIQSTIPGVVPPRVATSDPDILAMYHTLLGYAEARDTVDAINAQMKMPGLRLASDAIGQKIADERLRLFFNGHRLIAKAGVAGTHVMTGFRFERASGELVIDLKTLADIDEENAAAKGGRT